MILGTVCPIRNELVPSSECLTCSVSRQESCSYDTIVLANILHNRRVEGLSITEILSEFPRKSLLESLVDYYVIPELGYYAVRGKWVHESLRRVYLSPSFNGVIREQRFVHPKIPTSGQVDIYYGQQRRLVDYKSASRMVEAPLPGHVCQINAYAELLRANDLEVDEAFVTYLTYSQHCRFPVEVWERERTQDLLTTMYEFTNDCIAQRIVPPREACAGPDRWYICRYCQFRDICKEHPDWWEIEDGFEYKPTCCDKDIS